MARVPKSLSLEWLVGQREAEPSPNPLNELPEAEVDRLIKRCAAALRSYRWEFCRGHDKDNALAACESVMALLLEVRDIHPSRRADIDAVLAQYGYPVPEN